MEVHYTHNGYKAVIFRSVFGSFIFNKIEIRIDLRILLRTCSLDHQVAPKSFGLHQLMRLISSKKSPSNDKESICCLCKKPATAHLEPQYCDTLGAQIEWPKMRSDLSHARIMDSELLIEQCNILNLPIDFGITISLRESAAQER
jgi:hypothetical protein